ncbi:restriction endonuclease FokI C-terminal domain-containing protein [Clostridium perfringens]|uniref:restriction endonuclease FokI C-terminal domain-containing protein n=1 Tax=Clostridium perfringens TaxID=1502 RepID=UPI00096A7D5D|nr:restriction endonuclease FokI C-terminal domain-containing protein [Clostridium perfringens]MDK0934393.1 restriction endonuclease FokI C-terminal domain-containing protein [Clostridium perfringens]
MISIINVSNKNTRTFGWVQNPSNFDSLKKVVSIFDNTSKTYIELKDKKIKKLVEERDGQKKLINALNQNPLKIKYCDLVGTSFNPRSSARCNGIVQATVKGQRKEFIDDWSADNFVRWAHALGFIKYNYDTDTFEITELGRDYVHSEDASCEESMILEKAMLSYPPVARVLTLLSNGEHLTKYEIGKKLGFAGEAGFTSLPLNVLIMTLATTDEPKEKNKIKTDWDGSSDKYARMISGWLVKLGLLIQRPKLVTIDFGGEVYSETIGHAYMITDKGLKAVRKLLGVNKVARVSKNVFWEMLATKGIDKNYIRTRRAYILKILIESNKVLTLDNIKDKLELFDIKESITTIKDDINGLINTGINIKSETTGYKIYDSINDFIIPKIKDGDNVKSNISLLKDELRGQINHISHEYLSLVDLAFDSKQNRLFEMKVLELLVNEYGFKGKHLGGSRKPDGVVYSTTLEDNFGIIVDTKAYSGGYNLPISQADEMERYIRENTNRDEEVNPNKWWENFSEEVEKYYFVFISGSFKGKFEEQLKRLSMTTGVTGSAVNVVNLLLGAEKLKSGEFTIEELEKAMFNNSEFIVKY